MIFIMALLGGLIYRWRGSDYAWPRPIPQFAFVLPYALATDLHSHVAADIVLVLTTMALITGHGGFQDLGTWTKPRDDERLEFIIKWLHGRIPGYWYDALGLAITGLAITLPAGIALTNPLLALSGALKAPAYMIGWKIGGVNVPGLRKPTEIGEFLTGAFLWGALVMA